MSPTRYSKLDDVGNGYQQIAGRLSIRDALRAAAARNDLVPPRLEDKVSGEVGKRFSEGLTRALQQGRYDPQPAYFVGVPKNGYTTRMAAVLTLSDRVVYEAIVALLRPRIETFLFGDEVVFWPRGDWSGKRWAAFERSAIREGFGYVVRGDVTAFYESVDHERLMDVIVEATGERDVADALAHFLERVMGSRRGLPQGLVPSDALATLYLGKLDVGVVRQGLAYTRHGDDLRVATKTFTEGRAAVQCIESELRALGLVLNGEKTRVLRRDTYETAVDSFEHGLAAARIGAVDAAVGRLAKNADKLGEVLREFGMEELGWDFFYHGSVDLNAVIAKLRPKIKVEEVQVAEVLFRNTMRQMQEGDAQFNREGFHQQLVGALVRLSAGRSAAALGYVGTLVRAFPDKTEALCSYLRALAPARARKVAEIAEQAIVSCVTEWEFAWMARVLGRVHRYVSGDLLKVFGNVVAAPHEQWLAAVEVVKVLGVRGELEQDILRRMWNTAPQVFRVDLVVGAALMAEKEPWAKAFVLAAVREPIHEVAVRGGIGPTAYRRLQNS